MLFMVRRAPVKFKPRRANHKRNPSWKGATTVRQRRRQLLLDRVQSILIARVVFYWFFCLLAASLMASCWTAWDDPPTSSLELARKVLHAYGPALGATVLVLPLVVFDVLRLSNRFVGPMYRLRMALKEAASGRSVAPIKFRDDDFWRDVADDFNRALAQRQAGDAPTTAA